ncbi:MAG: hypothetical protein NVSMB31_00310 [Vulcanimicrobiaceae bacterium]
MLPFQHKKEIFVNTPIESPVQASSTETEPVISFSRVIQLAPASGSFSGWGVKVGAGGLLRTWN